MRRLDPAVIELPAAHMRLPKAPCDEHARSKSALQDLEFYELRHRALQWMIDPSEDGGLGLDIQIAARIAGHSDGGYLLCSTYTKLSQHRARTRAQSAIDAYLGTASKQRANTAVGS